MHYLITGGAGFIGSHLADFLVARGDHVCVIDDLSTGSMKNIAHLRSHPHFDYHIGSMLDTPLLAELVDEADAIFHLAAAVGVQLIIQSPVRTIETNVRCTECLLEIAAKKSRKVFVASTSEVYGKSTEFPFREDADLVLGATSKGRWSYACSKAVDEFLALAYWKEKKVPSVIGRLFNTVGPRQVGHYGMVVPRFVSQALSQQPLTVYGDGTQRRCFTHVHDAVRAIAALVDADHTVGEVYNIGSHNEVSIVGLAMEIKRIAGSESDIVYVDYSDAYEDGFEDMRRRIPCIEKIGRAVGWAPSRDLPDIITSVIDDMLLRAHDRQPPLSDIAH